MSATADTSSIAALVANDGGDGISLREAIVAANNTVGEDAITFDAGVFTGGDNSVIRLTQGELEIGNSLIIDGRSAADVLITGDADGNDVIVAGTNISDVPDNISDVSDGSSDLFDDNNGVLNFSGSTGDLELAGLTITGGFGTRFSLGVPVGEIRQGGGIRFQSFGTLTLNQINVSGNYAYGSGGGIAASFGDVSLINSNVNANSSGYSGTGGGISTGSGDVSLTNSTVADNFSNDDGGGIFTRSGDVSLTNSTVTRNKSGDAFYASYSSGSGGGIFTNSGVVSLTNSTVSDNSSSSSGGGIRALYGNVFLTRSTVSDNSASVNFYGVGYAGGGISSGSYRGSGDVSLVNSTISGNSNGDMSTGTNGFGGGIYVYGNLSLINSTVSGNHGRGGGVFTSFGNFFSSNSIIAGNNTIGGSSSDLDGNSGGDVIVENSLVGDTSGSGITASTGAGNILNQPALLGPLADNGGSTLTHALLPGSPAIDAGDNALALDENGNPLSTDQRGEARFEFGGTVDIGAYEGVFLLGDVDQNGEVNFLDIPAFVSVISGGDSLNEADINRDGSVNFLDIGPFVSVLSSDSSALSSKVRAPAVLSVSAATSEARVVDLTYSQAAPLVLESKPVPVSSKVELINTHPLRSLVLVNDSSAVPVVETRQLSVVDTQAVATTPVDTFVGPVVIAPVGSTSLVACKSSLGGSESNRPLLTRSSLKGNAERIELSDASRVTVPTAIVANEGSFSTAADLFDAHPESLDEVFDFEFQESVVGLLDE